ncbi:unnamed protein product [Ranitomeya imitator]|uniref:Uncharacterized protein n=1 Tax=Ranitomeya imitator TaxID=111125 RepID=A0ABN9LA51_9NEOB|nr:unnamed protein product [Ranitomeya imitator]
METFGEARLEPSGHLAPWRNSEKPDWDPLAIWQCTSLDCQIHKLVITYSLWERAKIGVPPVGVISPGNTEIAAYLIQARTNRSAVARILLNVFGPLWTFLRIMRFWHDTPEHDYGIVLLGTSLVRITIPQLIYVTHLDP